MRSRPDATPDSAPKTLAASAPPLSRFCFAVVTLASLVAGTASGAAAQTTEIGGQVRPRWENRSFATDDFASMRSRAHVRHTRDWGSAFVQIQDVRIWGDASSTTDPVANAIDVHQAWITAGRDSMYARIGRQEIALGEERLIGIANWLQQARSFDGIRGRLALGEMSVDVIGVQLIEESVFGVERSLGSIYGAWAPEPYRVEAFVIGDGDDEWRYTTGSRVLGTTAGFTWRGEASLQRGSVQPFFGPGVTDVSAWMASARVSHGLGPVTIAALYDHLSGDDEPADNTLRVFDTLYGTNHKFYGYADLFTDIPAHTGGRGLRDIALVVSGAAMGNTLELAVHRFDAAADDGLESGRFGEEIDFTVGRALGEGLQLSGGVSWIGAGPALEDVRGITDDLWWGYVSIDALF